MSKKSWTQQQEIEFLAAHLLSLTVPDYPTNLKWNDHPDWLTVEKNGKSDGNLGLEVTIAMDNADKDYSSDKMANVVTLRDAMDMEFYYDCEMVFGDGSSSRLYCYYPKDRTIRKWSIPYKDEKKSIDNMDESEKVELYDLRYCFSHHPAEDSNLLDCFSNPYYGYSLAAKCLEEKVKKLKSYDPTENNHLFIEYFGYTSDDDDIILGYLRSFSRIQLQYVRNYNRVYLNSLNCLIGFDFQNQTAFVYYPDKRAIDKTICRNKDGDVRMNDYNLKLYDDICSKHNYREIESNHEG